MQLYYFYLSINYDKINIVDVYGVDNDYNDVICVAVYLLCYLKNSDLKIQNLFKIIFVCRKRLWRNYYFSLFTPYIAKENTVMREAISPRMRLSGTLRYLATGNSFQDLMFSTRIATNSLSQIIPKTLQAIITVFEEKVISFPSKPEDWEIVADKFQTMWQFPHCIDTLDSKHIFFRPRRSDGSKYRNYKGRDSIILLALVDADYKFIFIDISKNDRIHDSSVS